jgi:integrase/recombinase XerC
MPAHVFESGHVAESGLPAQFEELLAGYLRHLRGQRNLAEHTVRAYRTDLLNLFTHLDRLGIDTVEKVDLRALRSWLAKQHTVGHARTTLQRRAAATRVFFAWAHPGTAANPGPGNGSSDAG